MGVGTNVIERIEAILILPLVMRAAPRIHEEVGDGVYLKTQLVRDGLLHLLGWAWGLLEDGFEGAALHVGEDKARLLHVALRLARLGLLLVLTGCNDNGKMRRTL